MCGQRNEFHYVGLSDRRPCVLLLLRWHYMKFLALLSCQCCLFPLLPPTPLSLSHFSRLRKQPPTHLQNSDACVTRARAAPLPGKVCVIPRLARQLGSLVARWLGSLLRLTPTSAVLFLFCVKRARFALGLTSIGHRFCAKIFPQKKRLSVAKKLCE